MQQKNNKATEPQIQAQLQKLEEECIKLTNTQSEAEVWTFSHKYIHLKADLYMLLIMCMQDGRHTYPEVIRHNACTRPRKLTQRVTHCVAPNKRTSCLR